MTDNRLRMLVPLDGSPEAETVLPALMPLFRKAKVRLTLFGVVPGKESAGSVETYFHRLRTSLLLDGVPSESKVEWGDPAGEILWIAKPNHFDLIAMTTHGRTGLRRVAAGSVTETVVRRAEMPVIACRPGAKVGEWNRILVPLDGSPEAEAILPDAARLARTTGATLHLIRVKSLLPFLATHHGIPLQLPEVDPRPYLDRVVNRLALEGILTLSDIRAGDEAEEIVACARETGADLVCLATHGRSGVTRQVLGSVAEGVLRTAPCPVLMRRIAADSARRFASDAAARSVQ